MYYLGCKYLHGMGVHADLDKAVSWWKRAAEVGHAASQDRLSSCYEFGQGVEQDLDLADMWLKRSEDGGHVSPFPRRRPRNEDR